MTAAGDKLTEPQIEMLVSFLEWEEACAKEGIQRPKFWGTDGLGGRRVSGALERRGLVKIGRTQSGHMGAHLTVAGRARAREEKPRHRGRAS